MQLRIIIDGVARGLEVPDEVLEEGGPFFERMDRDMDRGWQMGREWVERPDALDRCRVAADRLVTAMASGRRDVARLMAGYILKEMPGVAAVRVDTGAEIQDIEFLARSGGPLPGS